MSAPNKQIIVSQIKAIIIFNFLNSYNTLEEIIIKIFSDNISKCNDKMLNRLYFIYGGKIGTYIDVVNDSIKLTEMKFRTPENFNELKINQIIKLNKEYKFIHLFSTTIPSCNYSTQSFDFQDCIIKLINMRNILSHELSNCIFKDKDIIEILPNDKIKQLGYDFLQYYDIGLIDDQTKAVLSNYYYMQCILEILNT